MGSFGQHKGPNTDGNGSVDINNLGKRLASAKNGKKEEYDYFK